MLAENPCRRIGIAVVQGEVGAAHVDPQLVAFRDRRRHGTEIDGDFVNLTRLHQFGIEQRVAIASAQDSASDVLRKAIRMNINQLDGPVGIDGIGTDVKLRDNVSGERDRLGHRFAGVNQHVFAVFKGTIVDRPPHRPLQRAGCGDRIRGGWL